MKMNKINCVWSSDSLVYGSAPTSNMIAEETHEAFEEFTKKEKRNEYLCNAMLFK